MPQLLQLFIWIPLIGFLTALLVPQKMEKPLSSLAMAVTGIHLAGVVAFVLFWLMNSYPILDIKHIVLYKTTAFEFFIDFYFDKITAVYALVGDIIILLVSIFSRYYLHRDEGFAFLRTYQLLVSPSVLSYRIHDMFFNFSPDKQPGKKPFSKLSNAIYTLSIKEWNLDWYLYRFLWTPFKMIGRSIDFLVKRVPLMFLFAFFLLGLFGFITKDSIPDHLNNSFTHIFSILGLMLVLKAFAERGDAGRAWLLVIAGQCFVTLSIASNEYVALHQIFMYLSGVMVSAVAGYFCLYTIKQLNHDTDLNRFHGYSYEKPWLGFLFLLCCLGLIGFPFTPAFLGIDVLFTHIHANQILLIILTALSFIFIELAVLRIYARIFMGQHKRNDHPIAYRSS